MRRAEFSVQRAAVLLVPALIVGLLIAAQARTQEPRSRYATRYSIELTDVVYELQREQAALKTQLARLRDALDAAQRSGAALGGEAAALQEQIDALKVQAGLTALVGPGIVVTLDDAKLPPTAKDLVLAIVHSTDITDVFNLAWKGGAEAIAVNGERITGTSACVGAVIQINGTLLSPPYVISVIGPPERLLATFRDPAELRDIKARARQRGLGFTVASASELSLPAFTGPLHARYVQVR